MLKNIKIQFGVVSRNLKGSSKAGLATVCGISAIACKRPCLPALYILDNIVLTDTSCQLKKNNYL